MLSTVLVYDLKAHSDWLVQFRISFAIYIQATREKSASWFASMTSEEIIQINFLWYILSHCFSIYMQYLLKQLFTSVLVASDR